MASENMLQCLVADSPAFLKNAPLQHIGRRIFTIHEVINEIKDSATRQRLSVLPYTIEFREPSSESITTVTEFAKKTGDFQSLSAVDVKVMALAWQLEKEFCNIDHIKKEPEKKVHCVKGGGITQIKPEHGFVFVNRKEANRESGQTLIAKLDKGTTRELITSQDSINNQQNKTDIQSPPNANKEGIEQEYTINMEEEECNKSNLNEDGRGVEEEEEQEGLFVDEEDDGEGWITPSNVSKVKKEMGFQDSEGTAVDAKSACLTTDFAMQNVLMQMGLHVISLDGRIIRQTRSFILKCYGCARETTEMERQFCKNCGNKTLRKVSVSVNSDGSLTYHLPKRPRPVNLRGTKYPIPLPKAGRHANNLILAEDQKQVTNRLPKSKDIANAFDDDFIARTSPFVYKDVTSKAFNKGFHLKHDSRKNPNEGKRTKSKRK